MNNLFYFPPGTRLTLLTDDWFMFLDQCHLKCSLGVTANSKGIIIRVEQIEFIALYIYYLKIHHINYGKVE